MTKASNLADIPAPAGATHVDDWYDVDSPDAARYCTGGEWVVTEPNTKHPDITVQVDGTQYRNGQAAVHQDRGRRHRVAHRDDQRSSPFSR